VLEFGDVQFLLGEGLALIFDMDGVIVDSNPVHSEAWKTYLSGIGMTVDALEERMIGKRNDEIVRDFFGAGLTDFEVMARGAAKEALYRKMMAPSLQDRLVPGLTQLLDQCDGVPTGLATNAEPLNVQFVLEQSGLSARFDVVLDGHQVDRPRPHPEIYERIAGELCIAPENCIVFEDSFTGAEAARLAGARVVGVTTTHRQFSGVHFSTRDFRDSELLVWLSQQRPDARSR
jgi:HAD superfamily hydrolase (TIGR01509 family)